MNAPLRRVGVVVLVLFGLLFVNLNWVQAYKADEYRTSPYNGRVQVAEYERKRGNIEAGGTPLATSRETDGELKYLRTYPGGPAYAHVLGYKPVNLAATGIERSENEFLAGTSDQLLGDLDADAVRLLPGVGPRAEQRLRGAGIERPQAELGVRAAARPDGVVLRPVGRDQQRA